mmetsp:Transcript_22015/g.30951  ORF Transcript_22015/g.30951 Transcript_22015/m.30951 type:complete len:127 (+) Transcript_22015:124-504(+)
MPLVMQSPTPVADTSTMTTPSMNSTTSSSSIESIMSIIKKLEQKVDNMHIPIQTTISHSTTSTPYSPTNDTINPNTGKPWKRYCWSCGYTTHKGKDCPNKKEGHHDEASFKNRMGGSNKDCYPIKK